MKSLIKPLALMHASGDGTSTEDEYVKQARNKMK